MSWNKVAVVGAGLIKFGELFEQSYEQMAAGAFAAALANVDKGIDRAAVDAVIVATQRGTLWGQEGIGGNTVPSALGLSGVACTRVENACPSGSDAFRIGAMAVASGVHDIVLVIGVEKMRDKSTQEGLLARRRGGAPALQPGRDGAGAVRAVRHPPHARVRHHARDAGVGGGQEPSQRLPRPLRALPERDHRRPGPRLADGVQPAAPARLLPADRRGRGGDPHHPRTGPGVHRQAGVRGRASG